MSLRGSNETEVSAPARGAAVVELAKHRFRICMVGQSDAPYFRRWLGALRHRGHHVDAVAAGAPSDFASLADQPEHKRRTGILRTFRHLRRTQAQVRKLKPDVVLGESLVGPGWCAAHAKGVLRGVLCCGPDVSPLTPRSWFDEWMNRRSLARADILVAGSEFIRTCLLRYGVAAEKIVRVNCPLDPIPPEERCPAFSSLFGQAGLRPGQYFVALGGIRPASEHETLLDAILHVLRVVRDVRFVLIRHSVNPVYLSKLEAAILHKELSKVVLFLDAQPPEHLAVLYRNALGVISAGTLEEVPVVILEVLAMGVPVIAARTAPLQEIITHRENGLLVTPHSAGDLAEAILSLRSHEEWREAFAENSRKRLREYQSPTQGLFHLEERLHALLSQGKL